MSIVRHLTLPFHVTAIAEPQPGETIGAHAQIATIRPNGEIVTKILRRWN